MRTLLQRMNTTKFSKDSCSYWMTSEMNSSFMWVRGFRGMIPEDFRLVPALASDLVP